jgi:hypothetical protein
MLGSNFVVGAGGGGGWTNSLLVVGIGVVGIVVGGDCNDNIGASLPPRSFRFGSGVAWSGCDAGIRGSNTS